MCMSPFHPFLKALPKTELHLHLEGTLEPSLLLALAEKNNVTLPTDTDSAFASEASLKQRYSDWSCLDDFLHYYFIGMSVLVSADDFEELAWRYFERVNADGVRHAEVFFDPQMHVVRGVSYDTVVAGFSAARDRAWKELGLSSELICCFLRHIPVPDSLALFDDPQVQASFRDGRIMGVGLSSSEAPFPPTMFKPLFDKISDQGLKLRRTAHAGEEGPVSYIAEALDVLAVERVDHGLHLADDDGIMAKVAKQGALLTLCPWSNVVLKCIPTLAEAPIRKFLDAGVKFTVNSDDPAYFGGLYSLDVHCKVQEQFQLTVTEWEKITRDGIEASWCDDSRKEDLISELNAVVGEYREKLG